MAATLTYEIGSCSRCGGSGHYSYCQRFGTTCFKCGGKGKTMTKAGAKALAAVQAFKAEHFSVPVEALQPGDRVVYDGRVVTVATIETSGGGRYGAGTDTDGNTIWKDFVTVTFAKPVRSAFGPVGSYACAAGTAFVKAVSGADWDAVVAFARTIKKGVTISEQQKEG